MKMYKSQKGFGQMKISDMLVATIENQSLVELLSISWKFFLERCENDESFEGADLCSSY